MHDAEKTAKSMSCELPEGSAPNGSWSVQDLGHHNHEVAEQQGHHLASPLLRNWSNITCAPLENIVLLEQPPNSPDMNILDLCFFRSIQSLTDCRAPKNLRELIEAVQEEFEKYEVDKLAKSFVTLQSCLRETMKKQGGNGYDIPHMGKDKRLQEGRLPICLSCKAELVKDTLKLIEEAQAIESTTSSKEEKAEQLKQLIEQAEKRAKEKAEAATAHAQEAA